MILTRALFGMNGGYMSVIFRLLLTLSSLLLSFCIFLVAKGVWLSSFYSEYTSDLTMLPSMIIYLFIVFLFSISTIGITRFINAEHFKKDCFLLTEIANDSFLPSYLGYFFVSLSAASLTNNSWHSFMFVFSIMAIFIFHSRVSFFNPIFLLLGFNFFYMTTKNNVKIVLITKKSIKIPSDFESKKIKRINDYTFIDME